MNYDIATAIKTMCCWIRKRHIDQWNWIENTEILQHKYAQLIFDQNAEVNSMEK